jgi:integrase
MGIYQRGKSYYVDVRDGKGRRIRKCVGRSKPVAELAEKDLQVKIAKEKYLGIFEANPTPFAKYAAAWLERKKATLARSTYRDYLSIMNAHVLPHFGKIPLSRVTHRDVEDFLDGLVTLSAKRKNNIMVPVKCLFSDAKRRGDIRETPTELIRRLKEVKPFIDPFSFPEMKAFLANVDPHHLPYFATAFLTGMRPNEMLALKWQHVDFSMRCITVREGRVQGIEGPPKTHSSYRDIDILDPLYEVLRQHHATSPQEAVHVFTNKRDKPLEVNNLRNRVWYKALSQAGLRRRTMYQTRHTFASLMLSHGEDPLWVARMLGHTGPDMIYKHYGKFIRNRVRKDGTRFLEGFTEAEVVPVPGNKPTALNPPDPHSARPTGGEETVGLMAR